MAAESAPENLPPPVVSFVAFGDWGTGEGLQRDVAQAIQNYCAINPCEFILTLGDNFYENGVQSVTDPQWQTKYTDIYGPLNLPFYVNGGNHDSYGNIQAEIDYSKIDPTWHFPALNYNFTWPEESPEPLAEFFVVYVNPFTEEDGKRLSDAIVQSPAKWKFLVRHYPFISNRNPDIEDADLESAACNKVDIVLSGHDHLFSLLRGAIHGCWIEQVIIGTGGQTLEKQSSDRDEGRLVTTASVNGFGWFQVSDKKAIFRMIDSDGNVVYSYTWEKPAAPAEESP